MFYDQNIIYISRLFHACSIFRPSFSLPWILHRIFWLLQIVESHILGFPYPTLGFSLLEPNILLSAPFGRETNFHILKKIFTHFLLKMLHWSLVLIGIAQNLMFSQEVWNANEYWFGGERRKFRNRILHHCARPPLQILVTADSSGTDH